MVVSKSTDGGSIPSRPANIEPGLCKYCHWSRKINGKNSEFWYCEQSGTDEMYPKYPHLPVMACAKYKPKHPTHVPGWEGSLNELADAVASMRYDKLHEFLLHLATRISADGDADCIRGRKRLASALHMAGSMLRCAAGNTRNAWLICKPFMKEDGQ